MDSAQESGWPKRAPALKVKFKKKNQDTLKVSQISDLEDRNRLTSNNW